jgi:hypothetical protein
LHQLVLWLEGGMKRISWAFHAAGMWGCSRCCCACCRPTAQSWRLR